MHIRADVLLEVDGIKVSSEGVVSVLKDPELDSFHEVKLSYLFTRRHAADKVTVKVLRKEAAEGAGRADSGERAGVGEGLRFEVGSEAMLASATLWEWEKGITDEELKKTDRVSTNQVTIIDIESIETTATAAGAAAGAAAGVAAAGAAGAAAIAARGGGGGSVASVVVYTVLNDATKVVTRGVLPSRLAPLPTRASKQQGSWKKMSLSWDVQPLPVLRLPRKHQPGATLGYFMVGGVVFINRVWAEGISTDGRYIMSPDVIWQPQTDEKEQIVDLVKIFQHDCNFGYSAWHFFDSASVMGATLLAVNGTRIRNLQQLKSTCDAVQTGTLEFKFKGSSRPLLLDVTKCRTAEAELLGRCNMQACCSANLLTA
jgi:hypothetical protein